MVVCPGGLRCWCWCAGGGASAQSVRQAVVRLTNLASWRLGIDISLCLPPVDTLASTTYSAGREALNHKNRARRVGCRCTIWSCHTGPTVEGSHAQTGWCRRPCVPARLRWKASRVSEICLWNVLCMCLRDGAQPSGSSDCRRSRCVDRLAIRPGPAHGIPESSRVPCSTRTSSHMYRGGMCSDGAMCSGSLGHARGPHHREEVLMYMDCSARWRTASVHGGRRGTAVQVNTT